jgi:hypothetical protein
MQATTAYPSSSRIPLPGLLRPGSVSRASSGDWRIQELEPGRFQVGQVGGNDYEVVFHPDSRTWSCSCPDHQYRGGPCKHIIATWLRGPVTTVAEGGKVFIVPQSLNTNPIPTQNKGDTMNTNTPARPASPVAQRPGPSMSASPVAQRPGPSMSASPVAQRPGPSMSASPVAQRPGPSAPASPVVQRPGSSAPASPVAQRPGSSAPVSPVVQQPRPWERQYDRGDDLGESYPWVQWVNRGSDLEPQQPVGGFASPLDQDVNLPNSIYAILHHPEGSTEVMYTDRLEVAVLRRRFFWFDPKTRIRLPKYQPGARGKTQFLCYIKTDNGFIGPVKLTFTGMSGVYFDSARHEFAKAVRKATGGKAPAYAFWMAVTASNPVMVGKDQKSPICPPTWTGDFDPDRDFVGEVLDVIDWDAVDRWASPKAQPAITEPNGTGYEEEYEEYYDEEPAEEIPF